MDNNSKYTLTEALDGLLTMFTSRRPMGHNAFVVGERDRYAKLSLSSYVHGNFEKLSIEFYLNEREVASYRLSLTEKQFDVLPVYKSNPHIGGGYFSTADSKWYNYVPEIAKVSRALAAILNFHAIEYVSRLEVQRVTA